MAISAEQKRQPHENLYLVGSSAATEVGLQKIADRIFRTNSEQVGLRWLTSQEKRDFDHNLAKVLFLPAAIGSLALAAIVFAQDRHTPVVDVGYEIGETRFHQTKIRSQKHNAQEILDEVLKELNYTEAKNTGKLEGVHTEVGKVIRRRSLDELSQIIDIYRGYMSFVGPRPPTEREYHEEISSDPCRGFYVRGMENGVRFGLTGFSQVYLRNAALSTRLEWDEYYMQHASRDSDIRLLLATPQAVVSRRGAR